MCVYIHIKLHRSLLLFLRNCYLLDQLRIRKMKIFILSYSISSACLLYANLSFWPMSFFFSLKNLFEYFLHSGSLATNFLSVCLSEKALISLSFFKDNFTGYRILGWWLFLSILKNSSLHFLLVCVVSEQSDMIVFFAPL